MPVPGIFIGLFIRPDTVNLLSMYNRQSREVSVDVVFFVPPFPSLGLRAATFRINDTGNFFE